MSLHRSNWLPRIVKQHLGEVNTAIEVGVWQGDYSREIIQKLEPKIFVGVDPYEFREDYADTPDPNVFSEQKKLDNLFLSTQEKLNSMGHTLLRSTGIDAAGLFGDNSLDFVYIDGDHSYDFVSKDIKAWWPKIRSGGILSGHDYCWGHRPRNIPFGVMEAVDEHISNYNLEMDKTDEEFATWWTIKP
jgi:hypothetical protein